MNLDNLKILFKSLINFLTGRRVITFYFQTIRLSDALLALWYSFAVRFGMKSSANGRDHFLSDVNRIFEYKGAYLFGSARSGLYSLLTSLDYKANDEVIVTGFTCDVVPNAVIQAGLKPVYADIDPKTYCMSPDSTRKLITDKTKVIIIQHTFGIPADLEALLKIADENSLYVIEDCAVSLGSRYKGKLTGTFGDAAIFSFELSKTITACRGGLLLINTDKDQAVNKLDQFYQTVPEQSSEYSRNILFQLGLSGILFRPVIYNIGKYIIGQMFKRRIFKPSTPNPEKVALISDKYLLRLSNEQAVILNRQWSRLNQITKDNLERSKYYFAELINTVGIIPFDSQYLTSINLIRFPILVQNRLLLENSFREYNIELGLWFTAPISSPQIDQEVFGYSVGLCTEAEQISEKMCNLPMHGRIKESDVKKIIGIVREFTQVEK